MTTNVHPDRRDQLLSMSEMQRVVEWDMSLYDAARKLQEASNAIAVVLGEMRIMRESFRSRGGS